MLNVFKLCIASQGCQPAISGHETRSEHSIKKIEVWFCCSTEMKLWSAKNFLLKLSIKKKFCSLAQFCPMWINLTLKLPFSFDQLWVQLYCQRLKLLDIEGQMTGILLFKTNVWFLLSCHKMSCTVFIWHSLSSHTHKSLLVSSSPVHDLY